MYQIKEVDGVEFAETLTSLNSLVPEWPVLQPKHFERGYWWLVFLGGEVVGFAGLTPFEPLPDIGYMKRCYIAPDHHGHGLQYRMLTARIARARELCWTHIVSDCDASNIYSANNFRRAGFSLTDPEQKWAERPRPSLYWILEL